MIKTGDIKQIMLYISIFICTCILSVASFSLDSTCCVAAQLQTLTFLENNEKKTKKKTPCTSFQEFSQYKAPTHCHCGNGCVVMAPCPSGKL